MEKKELIRVVYLYLFSLVGLVLIIIGGVQVINLGLTTWVFTHADDVIVYPQQKADLPENNGGEKESDGSAADRIEQERKEYQEKVKRPRRERRAANAMAMLIAGVPLYLYHWRSVGKTNG